MIAELGRFSLSLALAAAILQAIAGLAPARAGELRERLASHAAVVQLLLIGLASLALLYLFVVSDFSVRIVVEHSHSAKPFLYRVAGTWGNHEGSMLLWVLILAAIGAATALAPRLDRELITRALGVQGVIGIAFLAFILATSDPFARVAPAPLEGNDLNPVLQDPALALHPPLLYFGYVGFSSAFAIAMAGLITGRIDAAWARTLRPWALLSWVALTIGIALGSYWAYYELGWGGFWFWDPVENASLLPWLAGTALIHSAIVVERREALKSWTVLLAILAFAMSLLGTFLVRSGVLTSVHAFAASPARGIFVLGIFIGLVGAALALFAWRSPALSAGGAFRNVSREGALLLNNVLIASAAAAVLTGTLYPLVLEALTGDLISVGPPYFNLVCGLIIVPLVVALPMGPLAAWKTADLGWILQRLSVAAICATLAGALVFALQSKTPIPAVLLIVGGVWLAVGALTDLVLRIGAKRGALARAGGLPLAIYGSALAHAGFGLLLIGIASASAFKFEALEVLHPGQSLKLGTTIELTLQSVTPGQGPNYTYERGTFVVRSGAGEQTIASERRHYWTRAVDTSEVGLLRQGLSHIYVVLGDPRSGQGYVVRAYHQPFILLIWLGALAIALGGLLAAGDGRLRRAISRGVRARAAARPVPAE